MHRMPIQKVAHDLFLDDECCDVFLVFYLQSVAVVGKPSCDGCRGDACQREEDSPKRTSLTENDRKNVAREVDGHQDN